LFSPGSEEEEASVSQQKPQMYEPYVGDGVTRRRITTDNFPSMSEEEQRKYAQYLKKMYPDLHNNAVAYYKEGMGAGYTPSGYQISRYIETKAGLWSFERLRDEYPEIYIAAVKKAMETSGFTEEQLSERQILMAARALVSGG
jgi:hypothetical protein